MNHLSKWGFGLTVIYLIMLVWLTSNRVGQLLTMPLNELGDFLAGAFGPLAIFWLILGFLQQGKELQQSTEALRLQAEELNNSVNQQKELVEVQRQMIELEKENVRLVQAKIKPLFVVADAHCAFQGGLRVSFRLKMINTGGGVVNVKLSSQAPLVFAPTNRFDEWKNEQSQRFEMQFESGLPEEHYVEFAICFRDTQGNEGKCSFVAKFQNAKGNAPPTIKVEPR